MSAQGENLRRKEDSFATVDNETEPSSSLTRSLTTSFARLGGDVWLG